MGAGPKTMHSSQVSRRQSANLRRPPTPTSTTCYQHGQEVGAWALNHQLPCSVGKSVFDEDVSGERRALGTLSTQRHPLHCPSLSPQYAVNSILKQHNYASNSFSESINSSGRNTILQVSRQRVLYSREVEVEVHRQSVLFFLSLQARGWFQCVGAIPFPCNDTSDEHEHFRPLRCTTF